MTDVLSTFFQTKLGFTSLESASIQTSSFTVSHKSVGWEVFSQALFIGADDYSDYLFPRRDTKTKYHQKTLGTYLGLDAMTTLAKLQRHREEANVAYAFEKRRIEANAADVRAAIKQAEEELRQVKAKLTAIDQGASILVDLSHATNIREQIAATLQRIGDLTDAESTLLIEEQQLKRESAQTQRGCQALREMVQFKIFLTDIHVEQCPHCEQAIPAIRVEEEVATGRCRVCHSDLRSLDSVEQHQAMLQVMEVKANEQTKALRKLKQEIKAIHDQIALEQQVLDKYQAELADLPRQERAGFTAELRELLANQGYWEGQLAQLQTQTKEAQEQRLMQLQHQRDILETAYRQFQTEVSKEHSDILQRLGTRTMQFAQSFGIRNLEEVTFNQRFDLTITQAGRMINFMGLEASEMLRLKIAFHLALLTMHVTQGVGRHPGVLIIDAPGGGEMDDQRLEAIVQGFADLKDQLGDHIQVLIASTKRELLAVCASDQVEARESDEMIF